MFSFENLDNAKISYEKLVARLASLNPKEGEELDAEAFAEGRRRFTDALDNDLNTSLAVTALYDVLKLNTNDKTKLLLIEDFDKVLALGLLKAREEALRAKDGTADSGVDKELEAYILDMIERRREAKRERNFALADGIRDELLSKGIVLKDTREGTTYEINK